MKYGHPAYTIIPTGVTQQAITLVVCNCGETDNCSLHTY